MDSKWWSSMLRHTRSSRTWELAVLSCPRGLPLLYQASTQGSNGLYTVPSS